MFPIRDHNPSARTPYVTWALIAINAVVFLMTWVAVPDEAAISQIFWDWGLVPARLSEGWGYDGLLTSMFLHAGWMHLLGNMLFLWIYGDNLEDTMGHLGYLVFYLACGVAAALCQALADPASDIPMVGASGAIAGVMGGYLLLFPRAKVDILLIIVIFFKVFTLPAWLLIGFWFAVQVFNGIAMAAQDGGVAHWAHAGGLVAGLILTVPVWLRRGGTGFWDRNAGRPPHPDAQYRRSTIPVVRR